jgi:tetratricopeptide (TPR) repeat protein
MEKILKINNLFIQIFYHLIVFAVPVYFSLFPKTNNVFELPKIFLFKVFVLILVFLLLVQLVFKADKLKLFKKYKNYFYILLFFLFCYFLNTFFFSINPSLSLFGSYDRLEGLESYIYYFWFFIISLYYFEDKKNVRRVLVTIFLSSILVGVYALLQAFGLDPLGWSESTAVRVTSSFGQPNNLGSYLLLVIPIGAYLAFIMKKWWLKAVFGLGVLINLLAMFYTYSTASFIGFVGAIIMIIVIHFFFCHPGGPKGNPGGGELRSKRGCPGVSRGRSFDCDKTDKDLNISEASSSGSRIFLFSLRSNKNSGMTKINVYRSFIILLFLIILFSFSYIALSQSKINTLKTKIENAFNWETGSTAARFDFWQASLSAIKERPLFGYGLDTQQEVLVKYYEPGWGVHSNVNTRPSRAHNIILDTWLTTGIIGVILFLLICYYLLRAIFINIKANRERVLNYCLLFSILSFFIYLQFNYMHVTGWVYLMMYSAIALVFKSEIRNPKSETNTKSKIINNKFLILNSSFLIYIIIVLAFIGVIWRVNGEFKTYTADHYWWEIRTSRASNAYFSAIKMYEYIKEDLPEYNDYDQQFASLMSDWLKEFPDPRFRVFGEEKLKEILPQMPERTFFEKYSQAKVLVALSDFDTNYLEEAEAIYQGLISYSPNFPLINREYAYMLAKSAQFSRANEQYEHTLAILPPLDANGLNSLHKARIKGEMSLNYQGLIDVNSELGNTEAVDKYRILLDSIKN